MNDDPIDFSDLDPAKDSQRFERAIDRISAAAAPILARRRLRESVWWQLTAWRKPVFAMGIAAVLLMIGVAQFEVSTVDDEPLSDDLALALGVPAGMSDWVANDESPTTAQILYPGEDQ